MCNCEELRGQLEAAERTLKQLGEPAYVLYLTRVPAAPSNILPTIGGVLLAIGLVILLSFIKLEESVQPQSVQTVQTQIEL